MTKYVTTAPYVHRLSCNSHLIIFKWNLINGSIIIMGTNSCVAISDCNRGSVMQCCNYHLQLTVKDVFSPFFSSSLDNRTWNIALGTTNLLTQGLLSFFIDNIEHTRPRRLFLYLVAVQILTSLLKLFYQVVGLQCTVVVSETNRLHACSYI